MNIQDFDFHLPESLIAQYPLPNRTDSRLLVYPGRVESIAHQFFYQLPEQLQAGDLLVMNNSKVIPARLYGQKQSGGQVELLVERLINSESFLAHIRASKAPKAGTMIRFAQGYELEVIERREDLFLCQTNGAVLPMLEAIGHIPLPPYIRRSDEQSDMERYQTVYAQPEGSVAAPTAGLHFDQPLLAVLNAKGVNIVYTTLHVGAGTFQPVRVENIAEHIMHSEYFSVDVQTCEAIHHAKARGKRVIAVGTTALRSVESAARNGALQPCQGDTDIFITPGFEFKVFDGLITNFHLPKSTLLMLVSAFIGHNQTMQLYAEAIAHSYRFFSYGDASLLWRL